VPRDANRPPRSPDLSIVAAGKAATAMAETFARVHEGRVRDVLIARGAHPVPDGASIEAGRRALLLARGARERGDLLVLLLSGGASSMMAVPAYGITLEDKIALTRVLLRSGLPIADVNAVRKHVSAIKGGQLAAAAGRSITYAISDVHSPIEDDPAVIGSGPTVADPSTFAEALRGVKLGSDQGQATFADGFASVLKHLQRGTDGKLAETPKPGDPRLADAEFVLAGSRQDAMDGAAAAAERLGYAVDRLSTPTLGDAAVAGRAFVELARARAESRVGPTCVIASGETTVRLGEATGVGGRNQEFALAAALAASKRGGFTSLTDAAVASIGTDGIDGPTDAAGAMVDATSIARAEAMGLDATVALARHDSYSFFRALGDLIVTGQTGTNVGDLQVFLTGPKRTGR
jgi:glycerate 2-kinase